MNKKQFLVSWVLAICLCPLIADAITFNDMLMWHPSKSQPFMGEHKNIKWVAHTPDSLEDPEAEKAALEAVTGPDAEADNRGQIDEGRIDLDGDGKDETIKVIWYGGVSDHGLAIEVYTDNKLISTLKGEYGIQSNYKIEDVDSDNKKEIIIWSGLWDFRMGAEDGIAEDAYEGHSDSHKYVVATYKFVRGEYYLWDIYTTKKKYEPFCEEQPIQ
jgi:hypothetical protein